MATPVVTISGGDATVTIGPWGVSMPLADLKAMVWQYCRRNHIDRDREDLVLSIAAEFRRQNIDPRSMTNAQIRNAIQAMEF